MIRPCAALSVLALACGSASAAVSFTGTTYSENFDTLSTANVTGAFSGTVGTNADVPGSAAATWQGAKIGGTNTTAMNFVADTGTGNAGALYSYGAASTTERALGALASGTQIGGFGLQITNNASDAISEFTITFSAEEYRKAIPSTSTGSAATNVLAFAWGTSGGAITSANFLVEPTMTANALGDVVGSTPLAFGATPVAMFTALGTVTVTITGLNVAVGDSIFLRWTDVNDVGNDAGLALDDFSFNAVLVPAPGAIALLGLGALVGIRRKR